MDTIPKAKLKGPSATLFQAITDLRTKRAVRPFKRLDDKDLTKKILEFEMIILSQQNTNVDIASELNVSQKKVSRIINAYNEQGFASLFRSIQGRKPNLTDKEDQVVCTYYIAYQKFNLSNHKIHLLLRDRGFDISSVTHLNRILKRMDLPSAGKKKNFKMDEALMALEEDKDALSSRLFQSAIADYSPKDLDIDSPDLDYPLRRYLAIRELLNKPKKTSKRNLCNKYGMNERRFQVLLDRFLIFGFEGLIDKPRGRATFSVTTPRMMVDLIHLWEDGVPWDQLPARLDASTASLSRAMNELKIGRSKPRLDKLKRDWALNSYQQVTRGSRKTPIKVNYLDDEFLQALDELKEKPLNICMPGVFLFAPLIQNLKLCEMVRGLGLTKEKGYSLFHYLLLDVNRKLIGVENINQLDSITDTSLALASGLAKLPGSATVHENLFRFDEPSVFKLMENLSRRALELGLVMGKKIAIDFHIVEYYGKNKLRLARWGQGPHTGKNRMVPGNRVLLAYDVETRTPIIAWRFNGKDRGAKVILDFFEEIMDRGIGIYHCETVLMDAEFPSKDVIDYYERRHVQFIFAYKQYKWVKEIHDDLSDRFQKVVDSDGKELEIFVMRLKIKSEWTDSVLIGYRNPDGKKFCLATNEDLLAIKDEHERALAGLKVVEEYRRRSDIEVEIFEQVSSFYLGRHPSTDEVVINLHYFTSLLAQMAYKQLQIFAPEDHQIRKRSLSSFRRDWIENKNAVLTLGEDDCLTIKYQEPARRKDQREEMEVIIKMLESSGTVSHLNDLRIQVIPAVIQEKN